MKFCSHCGQKIEDSADVCIHCFTPCKEESLPSRKNKSKEGNGVLIASIIILLAVIAFAACYFYLEVSFFNSLFDF